VTTGPPESRIWRRRWAGFASKMRQGGAPQYAVMFRRWRRKQERDEQQATEGLPA
jgi:hypothetical protein